MNNEELKKLIGDLYVEIKEVESFNYDLQKSIDAVEAENADFRKQHCRFLDSETQLKKYKLEIKDLLAFQEKQSLIVVQLTEDLANARNFHGKTIAQGNVK